MANKLVVLVDDDQGFRKGLERVLKAYGFSVRAFASAEEFQSTGNANEVSCFVLDINLTGLSGTALCQTLRNRGFTTPVIFITADGGEAVRSAVDASGCVAFLEKPFPAKLLVDAIRAA